MDLKELLETLILSEGGRISGSQLLKLINGDDKLKLETKRTLKQLIASIAVVEYGLITSQFSQTDDKEILKGLSAKKVLSRVSTIPEKPNEYVCNRYSTYTNNEHRLWWNAVLDCRQADMTRLLGLNPKLAYWTTALHYAAKFAHMGCLRLLLGQYKANVNAQCRGCTPLHLAVEYSNRLVICTLVNDYKADINLMDFFGYFPFMLLTKELKSDFKRMLTSGHLQRVRGALKLLSNTTENKSHNSKDNKILNIGHSEFKLPPSFNRSSFTHRFATRTSNSSHLLAKSTYPSVSLNRTVNAIPKSNSLFDNVLHYTATKAFQSLHKKSNNSDQTSLYGLLQRTDECQYDSRWIVKRMDSDKSMQSTGFNSRPVVRRLSNGESLGLPDKNVDHFCRSLSSSSTSLASKVTDSNYEQTDNCVFQVPLPPKSRKKYQSADPKALSLLLSLLPNGVSEQIASKNAGCKNRSVSFIHRVPIKHSTSVRSQSGCSKLSVSSASADGVQTLGRPLALSNCLAKRPLIDKSKSSSSSTLTHMGTLPDELTKSDDLDQSQMVSNFLGFDAPIMNKA